MPSLSKVKPKKRMRLNSAFSTSAIVCHHFAAAEHNSFVSSLFLLLYTYVQTVFS